MAAARHFTGRTGKMASSRPQSVALVWSQFAPYHLDRCEGVGRHFGARASVRAVEVATTSQTYAWDASGDLQHAEKGDAVPRPKL
jgi:hypothetical protein